MKNRCQNCIFFNSATDYCMHPCHADIQDLLEPLEKAISQILIPAITDHQCNPLDRDILALPASLGGMGLENPSHEAEREYAPSKRATAPLVDQIVAQSHQLHDESHIKST